MEKRNLDLGISKDAREYIADFKIDGKHPDWINTSAGRRIEFATMTDQEAIDVANMLYDMQVEGEHCAAKRHGAVH